MSEKEHTQKSESSGARREITAFVMLKVNGKDDDRIMDQLFRHPEVREIHSIHGAVDMLAKIVLPRDVHYSDAEIISTFVHDHIRLLKGVISTQTLIPGRSTTKR